MGSVTREIIIEAPAEELWAIIGDFAQGPERMAPGFVTGSTLDGPDLRIVTFANGTVLHERFIALDEAERRIVFSIVGGSVTPGHDNSSMQVFPHADGSRFVWIHDTLPHELADAFGASMEHGLQVFKQSVETAVVTSS
ncbi:SRPBCC family protein [Nocardia sp. NPDC049526]|uniref:SRPBCC family protein n=1 Tax=Nocardia sp. NPDC049526 TaxID=3364316 RepID=UPI0037AD7142